MNPTIVITNKSLISAGDQIMQLHAEGRFRVVGVAHKPADALQLIDELKPDIAVVDMHMPEVGGTALTRAIHAANPDQVVVLMSQFTDREHTAHAINAGAVGLVGKTTICADLARISDQLHAAATAH